MGCGMTKLNREDASGPMYFYYNPMHRNMEDLAPLHGSNKKKTDDHDTASKSLLEDGGGHEYNYVDNHHEAVHDRASLPRMSGVESECMVVKKAPMQQVNHVKAVDGSSIGGDPHSNNKLVDDKEKKDRVMVEDGKDKVNRKENQNDDGEIHDSSEKEDVDDSDDEDCARNATKLYAGSPSFRVYCVVSADSEDSCKNGEANEVKREKVLQNKDDDFTAIEPLKVLDKDDDYTAPKPMKIQSDLMVKKNRGRRRLRGVLTGRGGMKSLLHVAACNPHRSFSGHNQVT